MPVVVVPGNGAADDGDADQQPAGGRADGEQAAGGLLVMTVVSGNELPGGPQPDRDEAEAAVVAAATE